jgi:hypothetical protein
MRSLRNICVLTRVYLLPQAPFERERRLASREAISFRLVAATSIVLQVAKTPAHKRAFRFRQRNYFGGVSVFEAEPAGPVVVFGAIVGVPFAPPLSVIPELPPDEVPVVPDFFMASELLFVIPGLFMSCCPAGPVPCARAPLTSPIASAPVSATVFNMMEILLVGDAGQPSEVFSVPATFLKLKYLQCNIGRQSFHCAYYPPSRNDRSPKVPIHGFSGPPKLCGLQGRPVASAQIMLAVGMCTLYSITTNQDAIRRLFGVSLDSTGIFLECQGSFLTTKRRSSEIIRKDASSLKCAGACRRRQDSGTARHQYPQYLYLVGGAG